MIYLRYDIALGAISYASRMKERLLYRGCCNYIICICNSPFPVLLKNLKLVSNAPDRLKYPLVGNSLKLFAESLYVYVNCA